MTTAPVRLSRPLLRFDPRFRPFWEFFDATAAGVHARGRMLARSGVLDVKVSRGGLMAAVRSSSGPCYAVHLSWTGSFPVPARTTAWCGCPYRRHWCKHAVAAAYHLADRMAPEG